MSQDSLEIAARRAAPQADVERALDAMQAGGVAILPLDVAYAVVGTTPQAIRTIFTVKQRSYEKPSGMFATWEMSREIHEMSDAHHAIAEIIVRDYDLPFSIVAPFRADNPVLAAVDPFVLQSSSKLGTLDMLINAGPWHTAMAKLAISNEIDNAGNASGRKAGAARQD